MLHLRKLLLLCVIFVKGVFGVDGYEVKSVMEGDSVTLHTDITQIKTDQQILWLFGPQGTRIAQIHKQHNVCDPCESFKDRLKLDSQTGSLTITNITITNSGLYHLEIINSKETSYKRFNVTVYARLPIPDITCSKNSSSSSSSSSSERLNCSLLCSVMNVRDVSLSWYKGNSLLSIISVSDLNIRLSLPLEVEYQDNNTYRCVVNNPITNQTQHLNIRLSLPLEIKYQDNNTCSCVLNNNITNQTQHLNITHLCQTCSGSGFFWLCTAVVAVILFLVAVAAATVAAAVAVYNRNEQSEQDIQEAKPIKKKRILNFMEPVSVP